MSEIEHDKAGNSHKHLVDRIEFNKQLIYNENKSKNVIKRRMFDDTKALRQEIIIVKEVIQ